jgi:hypothetical protein
MLILWIRGKKNGQTKEDLKSFQEHVESMKKFCSSHPKIEKARSLDIFTADGLMLAPVQQVKLGKNVQN